MDRFFRTLAVSLLAVGAFLVLHSPLVALACTAPVGGHPFIPYCERFERSPIIVSGTVTNVTSTIGFPELDIATIAVEGYIKGTGPSTVVAQGYKDGNLCRSYVRVGQIGTYFLYGDPFARLTAQHFANSDAIIYDMDFERAQRELEAPCEKLKAFPYRAFVPSAVSWAEDG